ncbi:alpha/beta fold hydrolase [Corallococcus macrosporus]|uniref:alpha/beta fold hydrolase n=1 Tax=Corallococcus macrosporus TaxID=35 RepID=UPI0009E36E16|nr:alpha/beta hydrolase [Corallococcus macrosporus]
MRTTLLGAALVLLAACDSSPPGPTPDDPSSLHRVSRVEAVPGVELEVLDYGGQGPALVFLAGMGSTAHIYDDLALEFRDTHHVYALTRRGYGASAWPDTGYDTATLATDVLGALDALGVSKASFAGHSLAGDELTWLALHHPERVEALVYLDATDSRGEIAAFLEGAPLPPLPFSVLDGLPSRQAVAEQLARDLGGGLPAHEVEQAYEFDAATGAYLRERRHPGATEQSVRGAALMDLMDVRGPVLSLSDGQGFTAWVEALAAAEALPLEFREKARDFLPYIRQHETDLAAALRSHPGWTHLELEGAGHYIWLTNRAEVVARMRGFLATTATPWRLPGQDTPGQTGAHRGFSSAARSTPR